LIDALPTFFAEDLNTSLALPDAPKRLVLCFDTHEAFWGAQRDLSNELYFERDAWLRRLLRALDLKTGIVVVVAGRDRPRWAEATAAQEPIPNKFLDVQHIGHLADGDARVYLDRVGVPDGPLRNGLLEAARVAANEIHPYYLGLCVDIVQAAAAHGHAITADDFLLDPTITDKEQTLIDRLLKYVDRDVKDAVYALSACRSFDWIIYTTLAHALHFQATRAAFTTLLQLSFVWSAAPPGDGWYRIHDLLRRLLHDRGDPQVQKAHAILEQFYVERAKDGDDGAVVEAIYHANRQQWERGVDAWTNVFDRALQRSRLDLCRALLDLRTDLVLAPDGKRAGDVAFFLGMYYVRLSRHAEVLDAFATALSMYDGVLEHTPDAVDVLNNKGIVLQEMGEVYVHRTHYAQALSRYHQAAAVYDALEQQDPENMVILNNRGTVLQRLGDLHEERGENDRALACYRQAIDAYDAIIKHAPDDVDAYSNKSIVLRRRGNLQVKLMQHDEARDSYAQAVAACDTALRYAPNAVDVLRNKAVAQGRLAELHARNGQHRPAFHTYQSAVATADAALQHAPDDVYVLDGKGLVLKSWADTYQRVKQYQAALPVYEHAIAAFDAVLEHAPDNIYTLHNKGIALHNRANAHLELNNRAPALTDLYAARAVFDRSLMLAPHNQYIQQARHDTQQAIDSLENGGDDT
jgi:tetratricopeptide (TPR) repeat protein